MPRMRGAVAAADHAGRPLPLRVLPAPLRAALGVPGLRRARDHRPDVLDGDHDLQSLWRLDAHRDLARRVPEQDPKPKPRRIAPSILAADFARLGSQVAEVVDAGARVIHVDIMDGHFVPPLSMGPQVLSALVEQGFEGVEYDVHLMIERPERHLADFARAGAHNITVHAEATPHVHYAVQQIRELGCTAGVAVCPSTPLAIYEELDVDVALCMTVNPGWGGQAFIPSSLGKIERLRAPLGFGPDLEVDGGIDTATAGPAAQAGASLFVAGSALFGDADPAAAYTRIAAAAGCSHP